MVILEVERKDYNKKITATKPIIDRLTKINDLIAHFDIQESYLQYLVCEVQLKKDREKLFEKQQIYINAKQHLERLFQVLCKHKKLI